MSTFPTALKGFSPLNSFSYVPAIALFPKLYPRRICSHSWMPLQAAIQGALGFAVTIVYTGKVISREAVCEETIQPINQCAKNLYRYQTRQYSMRTGHLIKEECFPRMLLCQLCDGLSRPLERCHSFNTRSKARALE